MKTEIRKCARCRRDFESRADSNFCDSCIEDDREEERFSDCPACNRTYDDADADFLICSHCGFDANENKFKPQKKSKQRSLKGLGIDPEVKLDDWS